MGLTFEHLDTLVEESGQDFWVNLDEFAWTRRLIELVLHAPRVGDVAILTSGHVYSHAYAGKKRWLASKGFSHLGFIMTVDKHLCAGPGCCLIDDVPANAHKFDQYGGRSYIWPSDSHVSSGNADFELNRMAAWLYGL